MPALSSSSISAALEELSRLPASDRALLSGQCPGLAEYLAWVPDPRNRRGVRHSLTSLLMAAVAAVLAGATSFTAVGEWVADAPPQVLAALGVRRDPLTRRFVPPDEATIRRVLEAVDADRLDAAVGSWLDARLHAAGQAAGHGRRRRRAVAVDGKTNEITRFAPLLEPLDLAGCVITADALHTQREHAEFLVTGKRAHYILVVKKNQPGLYAQVKNLPWRHIPVASRQHNRGHGRQEHRTLKAAAVAVGLAFPHAAQAICLTRQVRPLDGGRWRTVTVYAITSLDAHQATRPARRLDPRPLADRGPAPPPRRQLRRRRLPDPHRQRTPGHGRPTWQPGHRHLENRRARQHRRRLQAPRPGRHPDPRNPRTAPSMNKTDTTRLRRGPGGEVAGRGLRSLR